jgi:hypothetical protein
MLIENMVVSPQYQGQCVRKLQMQELEDFGYQLNRKRGIF